MSSQSTEFLLVFATVSSLAGATHALPLGSQFRVNDQTQGTQIARSIAASPSGDFAVTWQDGNSAFLQRFDVTGRALYRGGLAVGQGVAALAFDATDDLIVVDESPDGSSSGIFAAIYNRSGSSVVSRFRVNVTTSGWQAGPRLAVGADGDFVVVWDSIGADSSSVFSFARRYRADGSPAGGEIAVGGPSKFCGCPSVAMDRLSNFAVTYTIEDIARATGEVYLRRFDSAGAAIGASQVVNTTTAGMQRQSRISMEPNSGQFVVVWESAATDGWRVNGQRFSGNGAKLGTELRVDTQATAAETQPEVAMADDGSFVVTWGSGPTGSSQPNFQVLGRSYSYGSDPLGGPFVVRSATTSTGFSAELGMDGAGNFAATWSAADEGTQDVFARRFLRDGYTVNTLSNGQTLSGLSASTFSWPPEGILSPFKYYKITVPPSTARLSVSISGGTSGDADLYLRYGLLPSTTVWNARPYLDGSNESIIVNQPAAGDWYVGVYAFTSYSGVSVTASYQ